MNKVCERLKYTKPTTTAEAKKETLAQCFIDFDFDFDIL